LRDLASKGNLAEDFDPFWKSPKFHEFRPLRWISGIPSRILISELTEIQAGIT
jgi:hypothetical protein